MRCIVSEDIIGALKMQNNFGAIKWTFQSKVIAPTLFYSLLTFVLCFFALMGSTRVKFGEKSYIDIQFWEAIAGSRAFLEGAVKKNQRVLEPLNLIRGRRISEPEPDPMLTPKNCSQEPGAGSRELVNFREIRSRSQ